MGVGVWRCVLLLAAATVASTADPDGQELFRKVRAKVLADVSRVPRYTCVQTVDRTQFQPLHGIRPESCKEVIAARRQLLSPGFVVWRDRLRLDVAVVDGEESFSWAGASRFETNHVDELVASGATNSGEFVSFLLSIFGGEPDSISFRPLSLFTFNVPMAKSHYTYHRRGGASRRTTGYHGSLRVDPETADLKFLTILADEFPADEATCSVEDTMNYHRVRIGNGDFLLPTVATLDILYQSGGESVNETRYSSCREYTGDSTIRFDDDNAPAAETMPEKSTSGPAASRRPQQGTFPPGLLFRIALASPIHSQTAAAGDAITGIVLGEVKDPAAGQVARENDIVHGRILQLEQNMFPAFWVIAVRFDSLEHDGVERPISLKSRAGGIFTFNQTGSLELDRTFQSEWETQ
jgi:hypothetical protein